MLSAGPLRLYGWFRPRMSMVVTTATVIMAGCAGSSTPPAAPVSGPEGASGSPEAIDREAVAVDLTPLSGAFDAYGRADYEGAAFTADSLLMLGRRAGDASLMPSLLLVRYEAEQAAAGDDGADDISALLADPEAADDRRDQARELAERLGDSAEEADGVLLLLGFPAAIGGGERDWIRRVAGGLSVSELALAGQLAGNEPRSGASVLTELSRSLALAGRSDSARTVAAGLDSGWDDIEDDDRDVLNAVLDGTLRASTDTIRVGAILPITGRFSSVGLLIQDGMMLALEEYLLGEAHAVELVVVDDASDPENTKDIVDQLEARDVVAIVGPIRSEALAAAAEAREYDGLVVLSPTATEVRDVQTRTFTLWERAPRALGAGDALGLWLAGDLGLKRFGALYPATPDGRERLSGFQTAIESLGGAMEQAVAYDPDSTTFEVPISMIAENEPEAVFVAAADPRTVLQLVPQTAFYGLRTAVLAGDAAWMDPEVVRRLDPVFANYRVVSGFTDRVSAGTAWQRFKAMYERKYRTALPDNMLAALGYDAMALLLVSLPEDGLGRPGPVGRRLARIRGFEGATGELDVRSDSSTIVRRPLTAMIVDHELLSADVAAVEAWREDARLREELRLELLEAEEEEKARREGDQR